MSDFDDTLVDTCDLKANAFRQLFASYPEHLPAIERLHRENSGLTRFEKFYRIHEEILSASLSQGRIAELDNALRSLVLRDIATCKIVDGALPLLRRLSHKVPFYVLSNTPEGELLEMLRALGLTPHVAAAFGFPRRKAEVLRDLAASHSLPSRRVVFIGDSAQDQRAAIEANVTFIARPAGGMPGLESATMQIADFVELDQRWDELLAKLP